MTIRELTEKLANMLLAEGFKAACEDDKIAETACCGYISAFLTRDGKGTVEKHSTEGYAITLDPIWKHNGANECVSVDIEIKNWVNRTGHPVMKVRTNIRMSDRQLANRVAKVLEAWEQL